MKHYPTPVRTEISARQVELPQLYRLLHARYGDLGWWPAKDVYEMCVGAILTQNTSWSSVEKAIANFEGRLSPELVNSLSDVQLADIIRPSGFFNQKTERIRAVTGWLAQYDCNPANAAGVPTDELRKQLLAIKGVGRETADSILVYAFGRQSFVVDAYTRRLLSRLGYDLPGDYDDIRGMIETAIEPDLYLYNNFHAVIVEQCKQYCLKKPRCEGLDADGSRTKKNSRMPNERASAEKENANERCSAEKRCPLAEICPRNGVSL